MRITALIENTTTKSCCTEPGLSLYIETACHKILFDAGASGNFAKNAQQLGVDLRKVDIAILSHGHSDHSDGMTKFFSINDHARLYARAGYANPRYSGAGGYIGVNDVLKDNPRVTVVDQDRLVIDEELTLAAYSKGECVQPVQTFGMTEEVGGTRQEESFSHEQYLIVSEGGKKALFIGCGHRGILNIMHWTSGENVRAVIGGFHFKDLPPDQFGPVLGPAARELKKCRATYYTCHCTGQEQYEYMKKLMGDQLQYLASGDVIEFYWTKMRMEISERNDPAAPAPRHGVFLG